MPTGDAMYGFTYCDGRRMPWRAVVGSRTDGGWEWRDVDGPLSTDARRQAVRSYPSPRQTVTTFNMYYSSATGDSLVEQFKQLGVWE